MCDDKNNYSDWSKNKSKANLSLEQNMFKILSKSPIKNLNTLYEISTVKNVFFIMYCIILYQYNTLIFI